MSTRVIRSIPEYRELRKQWYKEGLTVGFVPTMGALHQGHTSLVNKSKFECDITVASIFVNPAQFAPTEDLSKYPRTQDADLRMLQEAETDVLFLPSVEDIYPAGIPLDVSQQQGTFVSVEGKSHQMYAYP